VSEGNEVRKLGLIGGMSWVSTAMYYEQINKGVSRRKGGISSAPPHSASRRRGPRAW